MKSDGRTSRSEFLRTGNMYSVIAMIAIPMVINNLIITFYSLADGLFLAQLSSTDFAATSFIWPVLHLFVSIGLGASIAGTTIISQLIGAQNKERASKYANHLVLLMVFFGLFFMFLGLATARPILHWMGASGDFLEKSLVYLKINYLGLFFDMVFYSFISILNAEGNTKITTIISGSAAVLNIVLDPILIFTSFSIFSWVIPGMGWGVAGAAIATVASKFLAMIFGFIATKRKSEEVELGLKGLVFEKGIVQGIMKMAIPNSIAQSGVALGFLLLNRTVQSYGTDVMAAYSMVNRITDLLTQPSFSIGAALTTIIGQNYGAGLINRVQEAFIKSSIVTSILSLIGSFVIYVYRNELLSIFIRDKGNVVLYDSAIEYMFYSVFIILFMGMYAIYNGYFQGIGKMKYALYTSMFRLWGIRLPLIYLFDRFTSLNQTGIWISMLASNVVVIFLAHYLYRKVKNSNVFSLSL